MTAEPHWEHGWRCHGYWRGGMRVGSIGLTPPGWPVVYTAHVDGTATTWRSLKRAKHWVEREVQRLNP